MNNALQAVLSSLNCSLLQYHKNGLFTIEHSTNSWFTPLFPTSHDNGLFSINNQSLFLDDFIAEIDEDWQFNDQKSLKSGVWSEQLSNGLLLRLEAEALKIDGDIYILIKNLAGQFEEKQKTLQTAREVMIANENLLQEHQESQDRIQCLINANNTTGIEFETLSKAIHLMDSAVIISDKKLNCIVENPTAQKLFTIDNSCQQESSLTLILDLLDRQYPDFSQIVTSNEPWQGEICWMKPPFNLCWFKLSIIPIKEADGNFKHWVFLLSDITRLKYLQQQNEKMEQLDSLTQLPNRQYFWQTLSSTLSQNTYGYVIYINVTGFRQINEEHGDIIGDQVLKELAARIKQSLKREDIVARIGVDEFAITLNAVKNKGHCEKILERLVHIAQQPYLYNGINNLILNLNIGVSYFPGDGATSDRLIKCASIAAKYKSSSQSKPFSFYNELIEEECNKKEKIKKALFTAIENDQFSLLFQPIYNAKSLKVIKAEALIRWHHPELGQIMPNDFISVAEESGLIIPIGKWVFNEACKTLRSLSKQGITIEIAVNISPKQLNDATFPLFIEETINNNLVCAKNIELEITEGVLIRNFSAVLTQLKSLKDIGVNLSVDDFGTGYSSLSYLKKLPINTLKIDRSFITDLASDNNDKAITSAILAMAHELNLKVVAEGVEEQNQLDYLKQNNCDYIQGYFLNKPLTYQDLLQVLLKNANHKVSKINNATPK